MTPSRTIASPPEERRGRGIALRLGAATCFSAMGMLLKLASERGVSAPEMIFYRNIFAMPLVLAWIALGPGLAAIRTKAPRVHITRAAIGLVSMLLTFEALVLLPLAEATTITFSAPIFATLLSAAVLGERIGRHRWGAVLAGFAGILIVMRPGGEGAAIPLIGVAVGLAAAVGQSAVTVTLRQIGRTEGTAAIVFWFTFQATIVTALALPFVGRLHDLATMALLIPAGVAGGLAQIMMTASLRAAPIATLAPFDYVQLLWAVAFGWVIWATPPGLSTLLGAMLIALSGLYTVWLEHRYKLDRGVPATPPIE